MRGFRQNAERLHHEETHRCTVTCLACLNAVLRENSKHDETSAASAKQIARAVHRAVRWCYRETQPTRRLLRRDQQLIETHRQCQWRMTRATVQRVFVSLKSNKTQQKHVAANDR